MLEKIAYCAVIAVCCLVAFEAVRLPSSSSSNGEESRQLVGTTLSIPGARWNTPAAHNLVVAVSSRCKYCRQSAPFYRSLSQLHLVQPERFQFIVVSGDKPEELSQFLSTNAIAPDQAVTASLKGLGIRSTPTIVVADSRGRVQSSFIGSLSSEQERSLMALLDVAHH